MKLKRFLPECFAGFQVGLVAADADVHGVVTQEVRRSAGPLARTQKAAVHFEHAVVQQLVQDGWEKRKHSQETNTVQKHLV